jgi:hypothetical protein
MEFDDETVGIGNFDIPTQVPLSWRGVTDSQAVEALAPLGEVADRADAERDQTETMEGSCKRRGVVQAYYQPAAVADDDTAHMVFFFQAEERLEAEHGDVPVTAPHHVSHRQPHVVEPDDSRDRDTRVVHDRARS